LILGRGEGGPGNEVDSSFKNKHLWDMADSLPYLGLSHFQESIFPPITRPKIPAQALIPQN
jgi:hypothetical protein